MKFKIFNLEFQIIGIAVSMYWFYFVATSVRIYESIDCIYCNILTQQEFLMLILLNKSNLQVLFL